MKIETVNIDSLIPYEFNNVKHPDSQIDRIANSITEFGFNVPLIVNKDNVLIAGHGRLLAAKKLGLKNVPVVRNDKLTKAQQRAYRILDNKLTRDSEWDFENLGVEFDVLKEDGFDFAAWGLDTMMPSDLQVQILDDITLPDGDKSPFTQMTFTLTDDQAHQVDRAITSAKAIGVFIDTGNENSNGNALARVCEFFLTQNG